MSSQLMTERVYKDDWHIYYIY